MNSQIKLLARSACLSVSSQGLRTDMALSCTPSAVFTRPPRADRVFGSDSGAIRSRKFPQHAGAMACGAGVDRPFAINNISKARN